MHIRWWQSIRWRLALCSALLTLLATSLLALTAIFVVNYYYGVSQEDRLHQFAHEKVLAIEDYYAQDPNKNLVNAAQKAIKLSAGSAAQQQFDQPPLMIVFHRDGLPVYPVLTLGVSRAPSPPLSIAPLAPTEVSPALTPTAAQPTLTPQPTLTAQEREAAQARETAVARATANARATAVAVRNVATKESILSAALQLVNPSLQAQDLEKFKYDIQQAIQYDRSSDDAFGRDSPVGNAQPFSVRPIHSGTHVVGVLLVSVPPTILPRFVATVGIAVFIASLVIAVLAAAATILYSQTIMRPLARLTQATQVLAAGDYDAQVATHAPGELGLLAHNFNEMAVQLKQDVEELRRQEVWRRELIMNITHDLATPLTAIAGLGESLMDGVNQSREDYEATGRVIMGETLRLRRLVQDLHVMAKVEAGALQPKLKTVRLAALVDETLAVLISEFERHGVEPVNSVAYNLPAIQADPDMLTRVFTNLCNNSLHYTPSDGSVSIEALQHSDWLIVSVIDTGTGIPENALPRIFERFYRADDSRQSSTGGSGLGLAIVRAIIEAHGGTVWAENGAEVGAKISFTLPLRSEGQLPLAETPTLRIREKSGAARVK